jgi:hypothetical protein
MENLINKDEAIILQEIGFKEDTIFAFAKSGKTIHKLSFGNKGTFIDWDKDDDELPRPTYDEVFKWFKYNHKIYVNFLYANKWSSWTIHIEDGKILNYETFKTDAEEKIYNSNCFNALIEIFKNKK